MTKTVPTRSLFTRAVAVAALAMTAGSTLAQEAAPTQAVPAATLSEQAQTILFIGNSFTYGAHSPVWKYRADTVTDLNGDGVGGVPALFKLLTQEAGLDYRVSLETSGGKTLGWHWDNKRALVDRAWDHVVLQDLSTFTRKHPGDPATLIDYSGRFARLFAARNPRVDVSLTATWSRPDQTYLSTGYWYGKPIAQMARDLRAGYDQAKAASPIIGKVHPVGQAFTCAITAGLADPDPYDGISFDKVDLWTYDHYHASAAGYYLEALTVFIDVAGHDPRTFGEKEQAAAELGISPQHAAKLQDIAWRNAASNGACGSVTAAR